MSYVVGLTGGIGSGKTVASDHFSTLGVPVVDTDIIARKIVEPDKPALAKLVSTFGETILLENSNLDRAKLRTLAFSNKENKAKPRQTRRKQRDKSNPMFEAGNVIENYHSL